MKENKKPWIAAVLNFLLPGIGYFYAGKKHIFVSIGFTILSIWVAFHDWNEIVGILSGKIVMTEHFLLFIILYPVVFAVDGFIDAKKVNAVVTSVSA